MSKTMPQSRVLRLRNCLSTILELEASLQSTELGAMLEKEFNTLKRIASHFDVLMVEEDDVYRIEQATIRFLNELQDSAEEFPHSLGNSPRILN